MKKLLVIVLAVFFANAALAAEVRSNAPKASSNASANPNTSSSSDGSDGWQVSAKIHMSKFKVSGTFLDLDDGFKSYSGSKSNTPFSIAIAKEIMKSDSGDLLFEASFMTGEKHEETDSYSESDSYDYGYGHTENATVTISTSGKAEMKMALFASLYYQFNIPSVAGLKPYLGAGLGLAKLKATQSATLSLSVTECYYYGDCESESGSAPIFSDSSSKTNLAYQLALGANYFFNKNFGAGLGYAIRDYGSLSVHSSITDKSYSFDMKSSGLFGKLTYRF
ncbi:MAG: porin family protein [Helicobacteraceae bacterium]|jgi:opacity protein-like surface antigen|nr:porin family protein [Helicobacteraceae bacterium]